MNNNDIINILENELECINRASHCNRNCDKCDLVMEDTELIEAYENAIRIIKHNSKYRKAFKRFKRKYLYLKLLIRRALNEINDTADYELMMIIKLV